MKKLLITIIATVVVTSGFSQGQVFFGNGATTRVSTNSFPAGPATGLISGPVGSWYFALFVAPSTQNTVDYTLSGWTYVGTGTNTTVAGRFNGNTTTDLGIPVPGYPVSSTADFVVVGWSGNLTYDVQSALAFWNGGAANGPLPGGYSGGSIFFGISTVAQDLVLGGGAQPLPPLFSASTIHNMTLSVIPEPAVTTLAITGVLSIWLARRSANRST